MTITDQGYTELPVAVEIRMDVFTETGMIVIIANSSDPTAVANGITVVDTIQITSSRPHPLAHQQPGVLDCTLLVPPEHTWKLPWGRRFIVDTQIHPGVTRRIAYCWVTHWTRTWLREHNCWRYQITATDIFGVLAGHLVGDTPWPQEPLDTRKARINALSAIGNVIHPSTGNKTQIPARDVDRLPLLDLVQLMVPPSRVTIESETQVDGGTITRSIGEALHMGRLTVWPTTTAPGNISVSSVPPYDLPAGCIERVPVAGDRSASIGQISVTEPFNPGTGVLEAKTTTYRTTGLTYPTAALTFESDLQPAAYGGSVVPFLRSVLAFNAKPSEMMMEPCRIVQPPKEYQPWQVPSPGDLRNHFNLLVSPTVRTRQPIRIVDCPPDLEPYQIIIGTTVTIHRGRMSLAVTMVPARLSGVAAIRYSDVPTAGVAAPAAPVRFNNVGTAYDIPSSGPSKWRDYDFNRIA